MHARLLWNKPAHTEGFRVLKGFSYSGRRSAPEGYPPLTLQLPRSWWHPQQRTRLHSCSRLSTSACRKVIFMLMEAGT